MKHPVLGARLREISRVLLDLPGSDARVVMGSPDDLKLRSSMTLFTRVPGTDDVFKQVLEKYFSGEQDPKTIASLLA